jgi:glycosyltransferase involved in cell wall biosynthesis
MDIGMVLLNIDYPPDIRVDKEAGSLTAAGHRVHLACLSRKGRADAESLRGISVTRMTPSEPGLGRALNSLAYHATFRSPYWRDRLIAWARAEGIEAFHCHDLPFAPTVLEAGRRLDIPVVVDLHENYPAALAGWKSPDATERLFRVYQRYPGIELDVAREAFRTVTVVEEGLERFRAAGIPDEKLAVVSNTEPLSYGDEVRAMSRDPRFGDDIVLLYAGGFAPDRGIDVVISAMPELLDTGRPYRLVLAGDGEVLDDMKDLAASLRVAHRVEFTGWIDTSAVRSLVASTDIGLVPHRKNEQRETTIPHKLFQFMVSGKAVAVSDCAPLKRIVEGDGAGVVVTPSDDPRAWARTLAALSAREAAAMMGARGRAACEARYNWETDGAKLVAVYEAIQGASPSRAPSSEKAAV